MNHVMVSCGRSAALVFVLLQYALGFQSRPVTPAPRPTKSDLEAANDANRFLGEAKAAEGRHDAAIAEQKYKQLLSIAKRHNLGAGLESLALRGLGQIEIQRHNEAAALIYAKQHLDATRRIPGDTNIDLTDALTEMATLSLLLGRGDDAERYWKEASALLSTCATSTDSADALRRCRMKYWDGYATMASILFLHNQDARAAKMLQDVLDAPETEVRPLVLLVVLRAQTTILMRNGKAKEAFLVLQRSAVYERDHPEVVAQLGPAQTYDAAVARAVAGMREMADQAVTGKLSPQYDFSGYGKYGAAMQLMHDALLECQEVVAEERKRIDDLHLADVLSPNAIQDATHLQTSRELVRAAMLEEARLTVKTQNIVSNLERGLNERIASSPPDERVLMQPVLLGTEVRPLQSERQRRTI